MDNSVLFVDQSGDVAGGQVVLQALIRAAKGDGRRVAVLAPTGGTLENVLRKTWGADLTLHELKPLALQHRRKGWKDIILLLAYCGYVLRFWRLVAGFDVVYINGARLAVPFFFLSLLTRRPKWCYHLHLCHSGLEKQLFSLIAAASGTGSLIMASRFIYEEFVKACPHCRRDRLRIVENSLGAEFADLPFADRFSHRRAPLTVALIGRVVPYKGHDVLPMLARQFPDLRFVIIGARTTETGTLLSDLAAQGLPNLEYLGESRDLPRTIESAAIHFSIVPSRWEEPFGLVSIESMAASCITLVANRGMLSHIAEVTGAWCFRSDEELCAMIDELRRMTAADLRALAQRQFENTKMNYGLSAFRAGILSVLDGRPAFHREDPRPRMPAGTQGEAVAAGRGTC